MHKYTSALPNSIQSSMVLRYLARHLCFYLNACTTTIPYSIEKYGTWPFWSKNNRCVEIWNWNRKMRRKESLTHWHLGMQQWCCHLSFDRKSANHRNAFSLTFYVCFGCIFACPWLVFQARGFVWFLNTTRNPSLDSYDKRKKSQ